MHVRFQKVKVKMEEEAERDRELYTQRVALAEEGQELAKEDRKQLQVREGLLCCRQFRDSTSFVGNLSFLR